MGMSAARSASGPRANRRATSSRMPGDSAEICEATMGMPDQHARLKWCAYSFSESVRFDHASSTSSGTIGMFCGHK